MFKSKKVPVVLAIATGVSLLLVFASDINILPSPEAAVTTLVTDARATPATPGINTPPKATLPASALGTLANSTRAADASATSQEDAALLALPDTNPEYPTFGHRVSEISNRRQGQPVDIAALYAASQLPAAWQSSDALPDSFPLSEEDRMDGREFITINPLKIESLVEGDTLDIEIGQNNGRYTARIDRVMVQSDNNVSWFGHLENVPGLEGQTHVYLTRGDHLIIGGITTPDGHFEIEARGDQGWIASGATLFKHGDQLVNVDEKTLKTTPAVSQEALAQKGEPVFVTPGLPQ